MSFTQDREGQRRRKSDPDSDLPPDNLPGRKRKKTSTDVGSALRSAYQRVVAEDIPPEMLDLLGKLG